MRLFLLAGCALLLSGPAFAATISISVNGTPGRDCYLATLQKSTPESDQAGIAACDKAVIADKNDTYNEMAALVNRADIRLRTKDYKMAVEDAEQALALDPTEAVAHLNRGAGMVGLRRYQDAIAALDQAIALKIEPLQIAYFNRALAKEALGDVPGAYHDYKSAVDVDPKFQLAAEELTRFTVTDR
jgi:tetratricopeptide (TPR) repeat protein